MSLKKGVYGADNQRQNLKKINRPSVETRGNNYGMGTLVEGTFVFWLFDNFLLLSKKFPSTVVVI